MGLIDINRNPSDRQMRQFSAAWLVFFGIIGFLTFAKAENITVAVVLWSAGAVGGAVGWVRPQAMKPIHLGMAWATWPIGTVVSLAVLTGVYLVIITPIALVMRLMRRDAMRLRRDESATSYWLARKPVKDVERYFRQY